MATLLLSCDQPIKCYQGEYYAKDQEGYGFFLRYLRVFEKLRLAVRCEKMAKCDGSWVKIDSERIEIVNVPSFSGPAQYAKVYFSVGKAIERVTDGCDAAIIRIPSTIGQRVAHKVIKANLPYAVEVVYDAYDGATNSRSFIERMLWKRLDYDMQHISFGASGVSCVTEKYLQRRYFSQRPDAFYSSYSSLSLNKEFYTAARSYPHKEKMKIVHVSSQVDCNTRKGHIQLIKMMTLLKAHGKNVELQFVGEDYHDGVSKLTQLAKDLGVLNCVKFTGRATRQQLSSILDNSDLFVFPTAAEGLPRVVIEAMAKGLPCIISNVSGNPELVQQEMLVGYKDIRGLASKVEMLIDNKAMYESVSKQNFEKSLAYESSILEKRRDEFYKELKSRCSEQ